MFVDTVFGLFARLIWPPYAFGGITLRASAILGWFTCGSAVYMLRTITRRLLRESCLKSGCFTLEIIVWTRENRITCIKLIREIVVLVVTRKILVCLHVVCFFLSMYNCFLSTMVDHQ